MAVVVYRSTDPSAPVLDGQAGSLIAVLDAVLVNGYGSLPSLGWTKPYNGTNLAAYRMPTGSTNGRYLAVNDTFGAYADIRAYEAMTAVSTGTGAFPTTGQLTNAYWTKSADTATNPTAWVVVGTNKLFYIWIRRYPTADNVTPGGTGGVLFCFGDFLSLKPGDQYNTLISVSNNNSTNVQNLMYGNTTLATTISDLYIARSHTQTGTAIQGSRTSDAVKCGLSASTIFGGASVSSFLLTYPNNVNSVLYMAPICIGESNGTLRGYYPGLYTPLHYRPLSTGDQFAGVGSYAGKTFEAFTLRNNGQNATGQLFIEVSDTW